MSRLRYDATPPAAISGEGPLRERALARALARWVQCHGGSARLATLAGRAAVAEMAGDTALEDLDSDTRDALRAEPLVGDGTRQTPFVLDSHGRFYLWRNFQHEVEVAAMVATRRGLAAPVSMPGGALEELFPGGDITLDGMQREAVRAVGGRRFFVLTGGPGTGKTTTVLRMLVRLQADGAAAGGVVVAAPTGKAAQRLLQSLRDESLRLRERLGTDRLAALEALPTRDASTVHRLLGWSPTRHAYARGPDSPIAAGIVVVDEASMLDLAQLRALLRALRPEATLVLVGDADQLNPIGAGSVLMDLVKVLESQGAPDLVRLRHSFRASRQLVAVNEAVRRGDAALLASALDSAGEHAQLRGVESPAALSRELMRWADQLAGDGPPRSTRQAQDATDVDPHAAALGAAVALRHLSRRQLLCALREGPYGTEAINATLERHLRLRWRVPADQAWYPGRVVIVTRNDHAAGLFNGDVGLCHPDAEGSLQVWFGGIDGESVRAFAPGALPAHEPAWALTIHKSQGSEYAHAAVLLPPDPEHRILSRQLLYTGLSRAKASLEIWGPRASIDAALSRTVRRAGGLADRLKR